LVSSESPFLDDRHELVFELIADGDLGLPDVDGAGLDLAELPDVDDKGIVYAGKRRVQLGFNIL
jgi:hypothetical protein